MGDLHWTETDFGDIVATFSLFYAFGYVGVGRLMDKVGVRLGLSCSVAAWSVFACLHAAMSSVLGFKFVRGGLGLAEGGNFPACIKSVAEWFPVKERALATGIFNAGSNVGAVAAPIIVPLLLLFASWRVAFLVTGAIGFVWVIAWHLIYRKPEEHPKLSAAELAYIRSDPVTDQVRIPWLKLLGYRGTWANIAGTCLSAPVWWFYLNWVPGFLSKRFGINLMDAMLPLVVIYCMADIGSVGGGWLSSHLIKRGVKTLRARKIAFLVCGLCVLPVFLACRCRQRMVGGPADRCGGVGPSGLFGQRLHHRVRHHATERCRLGGRDRRILRLHRQHVRVDGRRTPAGCDQRQLSRSCSASHHRYT